MVRIKKTRSEEELYVKAKSYYSNENYQRALLYFTALADNNDSRAQNYLGLMYYKGRGVEKNISLAKDWYFKSLNSEESTTTQYNLGCLFYHEKDYKSAITWLKKAAENNHSDAQNYLGIMYHNGFEVEKNISVAKDWYFKSIENGGGLVAEYNLGSLLYNEKDYENALIYLRKAAEKDCPRAQNYLGTIYEHGQGVEKNIQVAKDWYLKSLNNKDGYENAQYALGNLLYNEGDYKNASIWIKKVAEKNDSNAQNSLGLMYQKGLGIEIDYNLAIKWFHKSAYQNNKTAQLNLGILWLDCLGVEKNVEEALDWFKKSASNNNLEAYKYIGDIYMEGNGVEKSYKLALDWYMKAANEGFIRVLHIIGRLFRNGGYGIEQSYNKAEYWFMKGIEKGDPDSIYEMGRLYAQRTDYKQSFKQSLEWLIKAEKLGHAGAQNSLGIFHRDGLEYKKDYNLAMQWFKKAEENGCHAATANIGSLYHHGHGVLTNYAEALKMYEKAGACGPALNGTGLLYQNGLGVDQNHSKAMSYFKKAADINFGDGFNSMGDVYAYGYNVDVDYDLAFKYYKKSIECNDYISNKGQYSLFVMYLNGLGTEVNQSTALFWLRESAKNGNEKANAHINQLAMNLTQLPQVIYPKEEKSEVHPQEIQTPENESLKQTNTENFNNHKDSPKIDLFEEENQEPEKKHFTELSSPKKEGATSTKNKSKTKFFQAQKEDIPKEYEPQVRFFYF